MLLEQEGKLVERAKYSAEAFGELYDCYFKMIFGYVLRRSADIDIAKDITSAVFLKAMKNIKKFKWHGVPFSHWLYRIANNEIIDYHKKRKREINVEMESFLAVDNNDYETVIGRNEVRKYDEYLDLHSAISKLPPKYQEVIALRYFEDLNIDAIAEILQKPEGTVKSLIHRGVNQLRELVRSQELNNVQ